jgi:predicted transcriptional regulator
MYTDILSVLAQGESLGITHLMYKVNINCTILKEYVDFLIHQGLIEEHLGIKPKAFYSVTKRGITVLQQFNDLKKVLPIIEETQNQE